MCQIFARKTEPARIFPRESAMKNPEMPNVRERINPNGDRVYFIDYFDIRTEKRVRETVGPRKADAQKRASYVYQQMMARFVGEPEEPLGEMTINELVDAYFRGKAGRTSNATIKRYRIYAKHFLDFMTKSFPGAVQIRSIKKVYVEEHLEALRKEGYEPKTLNGQLHFIKALFKFAVDENYLTDNPIQKIKPYRETKPAEAISYWEKDEVRKILAEAKPTYRDTFEFLYHTGLRKGELINLTWGDVDLKSKSPVIKIQSKKEWDIKTLKRRVVPLNARAAELIRRQKRSGTSTYVFTAPEGGQIHRDRIYHELKRALGVLGLEGDVHKWRHTFASHLVMNGVGLETVSKLLGHQSIEMTMKYAHLAPDHLQNAVRSLEGIISE
jgi:integrase